MDNELAGKEHFHYHKMGSIIRRYRNEKGLKLLELSELTGVKSSMLSKIENGRMIPTIPTLFTIIHKLGIAPDAFFAEFVTENQFAGYLFLPKEGFTAYEKEQDAKGFQYFSILENNFGGGDLQISLVNLQPDCSRPLVTTAAYEFIMVLNGSVNYQLEESLIEMKQGDALFFDGNIPHVPHNAGREMATLLVLYLFGDTNKVG